MLDLSIVLGGGMIFSVWMTTSDRTLYISSVYAMILKVVVIIL